MKYLKIIIPVLFLVFVSGMNVSAQNADNKDVRIIAESFLDSYFREHSRKIESLTLHGSDERPLIYIVNLDPEGWLLISGNKGALPVFGFNYTGSFTFPDFNKSNPAYNWLEQSAEQLEELYLDPADRIDPHWVEGYEYDPAKSDLTVLPLISAEWGQGTGWNQLCPEDLAGPDGHALVGCVAVAMAQALSVYELPESGLGEKSYDHFVYGTISTDYSQSAYRWDLMSDYTANEYSAKLLYDCATSVEMNFGPDASSATTSRAIAAFETHFSMSESMQYLYRESYDVNQWEAMIRNELKYGRPIILRGRSDDGESGHAFNVDGVVDNSYFHINWGWYGNSNGYFFLHELNPGTRSYNRSQAAILGIRPNSTSIESIHSFGELNIFPNPAYSEIRLNLESTDQLSHLRIYSLSGTMIKSFEVNSTGEGVDVSDLSKGIYIIEAVLTNKRSIRKKLIKQ